MTEDTISMSRDDLKALIREAVREEFFAVGLRADADDHIEEARKDFVFIRKTRLAMDSMASKIGWLVMMTVITGGLAALWIGFKASLAKGS